MQPFWYRTFPRLTFLARRLSGANFEREMGLLPVLCDPARTGIDIGAKVGMYTYRIRQRSSDVIAFEPIPLFNEMLKKVFDGKRGRIEPVAVSDRHGRATLRMPYDRKGGPQLGRSTIDAGNKLAHAQTVTIEELEVETRALDEYALTNVGFIKIDVEGHELAVLDGATQTIAASRPNLLVECNDDHHAGGVAKLGSWLDAHDDDACVLAGRELVPIARYDRAEHWGKATIENFIGIHRSRPEVRARLVELVKTARLGEMPR
jgi:FkbM family methyltransferase